MDTYEQTFTVKTKDCDLNALWRFSGILEAMQEAAGEHSEALGAGRDKLLEANRAWVLVRSQTEMERYPTVGERITIFTFPKPSRHLLYPRFFLFRDASGETIGKASTLWTIMDLGKRQAVLDRETDLLIPRNESIRPPMPYPGTVQKTEGEIRTCSYRPLYTDLDWLGHVNNTRYADWLCNILGTEKLKRCAIRFMTINYNSELLPDQEVELRWTEQENGIWLSGYCLGKDAFEISCGLSMR